MTPKHIHRNHLPVAHRETGLFERRIDVSGGNGVIQTIQFEMDLAWLRISHTVFQLIGRNGLIVAEEKGVEDFSRLLESAWSAMKRCNAIAHRYDVTPDGTLAVVAKTVVADYPVTEKGIVNDRPEYQPTALDLCYAIDRSDPEAALQLDLYSKPQRVKPRIVCDVELWSSRVADPSAKEALFRQGIEAGLVGLSTTQQQDVRIHFEAVF